MLTHIASRCHYAFEVQDHPPIYRGDEILIEGPFESQTSVWNCLTERQFLNSKEFEILALDEHQASPFLRLISHKRLEFANWLDKQMSPISASYTKVLILGDKSSLKQNHINLFKAYGILYLLAISGFHIHFFYGGFSRFLYLTPSRFVNLKKWMIWILFLLYIPFAGFGPAVCRAIFAQGIKIWSDSSESNWSLWEQGKWSFFICLAMNPLWIFHLGFQLSFLATLAIQQLTWIKLKPEALSISLRAVLGTVGILIIKLDGLPLLGLILQLPSQLYIVLILFINCLHIILNTFGISHLHDLGSLSDFLHQLHILYLQEFEYLNSFFVLENQSKIWMSLYVLWLIWTMKLCLKKE